ncbi:MAG: PHA/PHB synthase family protein [Gammaproteobacteria bacterium]
MKNKSKAKIHNPKSKNEVNETIAMSAPTSYEGQAYDIMLHAWMGKMTGWLSPASLGLASFDWLSHFIISPAKQFDLAQKAWKNLSNHFLNTAACLGVVPNGEEIPCIESRSSDHRFKDDLWNEVPFKLYVQTFLFYEKWWNEATTNVRGVSKHHVDVVNFTARQILDMLAPSNCPFTNPEVIKASINEGGANFVRGLNNFVEDYYRIQNNLPPAGAEKFKVGVDVAITEGKVIYRNHLIELIQYEPTTKSVYAEPILITPAWIMKYYILDLSPHNSLVKYLVDKGHTVFMISWKNPDGNDRNLGLDDYLNLGIMSAIDVINKVLPNKKINALGYCLGGTLLMIAAAAMAGDGDERLKSITLLAAQVDFRNPGELSLFIDQSQITYLEDIMWEKGYLDGSQMSWAFSMLRSNDLIWSRLVHDYLLGKRRAMNDLIAWDHDTTRLPYKMHSEYLHNLFLKNDLVQGHFEANKKRIALTDIKIPLFVVATLKDHVSPWRSVYKIQLFTDTDFTFVLTNGGHNAGIVSEPGHQGRHYQINTRKRGDKHISSSSWLEKAEHCKGSWWPAWNKWLINLSNEKVNASSIDDQKQFVICDAPGTYVHEK